VAALSNRLENLPGLTLRVRRAASVADTTAAWVEVVAPGTGDALAASGAGTPVVPAGKLLIPTRQVTLGFLRPEATLYIAWHVPEASYGQIEPEIEATIASLRFTSSGTRSSYSN